MEVISSSTRGFVVSALLTAVQYALVCTALLLPCDMHFQVKNFHLYCLFELDWTILQVSFGSLIGFLPYRNLGAKWKFLAFESWLRQKGLDPSMYRQNLGTIGSYDVSNRITTLNSSVDPKVDKNLGGEILADMKLEDLLRVYDQEKMKFLSSFVGQVWKKLI